jgi:hypothetical protein
MGGMDYLQEKDMGIIAVIGRIGMDNNVRRNP